ncbi:unnamed protein product [Rotaria sp. Silwood2]|nr:unnamed protein product [Rotaria sp. Silwood2]CAF4390603.1 unnamed protein product [Rotaria sp. Silwood2]
MLNIRNELSFLLLNISSLKLYLYDLFELLNSIHVSIIVLNGTRHDNDTLKNFSMHLNNYHVFYQEGTNAFGGVLIATHRSIPAQRVLKFQNNSNLIVLDIGSSSNKFQLVTCYSPPNEPLPVSLLSDIMCRNPNTILLGDLNAKHNSWSKTPLNQKGRILFEWLNDNDLQVVNKFVPTSTRSNAAIDLILAPMSMLSGSCTVLPSIGSDHYPVIWSSTLTVTSKERFFPIKRTYWLLYELFITYTSSFWNDLCEIMTDKVEFFCLYERFLSLASSRLTYVSYCNTYKPSIPPQIVHLIQIKRHYLYLVRKTKLPYYILQLKLYSQHIRKALYFHKRRTWSKYCGTLNSCDVKQFWRKTKRHFSSYSPPIDGILQNGVIITSPEKMCYIAKNFYLDQFSEHNNDQSIIELEADAIDQELYIEIQNSKLDHFQIEFIDVKKSILSLKNKNSTGLDGISNRIIKLLPSSHIVFITSCLNYMAEHVRVPQHWLTARMILLSKTKSSIAEINDTRPISLLPCFSKLNEKIFLMHFRKWISENGLLPEEQTGFRSGHNMSTRIVAMVDQIGQGLAVNTATAALFIDFKTAFNQLWFKGLWLKLKRLNCPLYIITWLRNYLLGRSAFIEIKGHKSTSFPLFKGVPQGSCLGPVLFIVFHYDILNTVSSLHFKHLFADDLAVVVSPSVTWSSNMIIPYLSEQITSVIKDLYQYSIIWKQPLNFKKTYWTLFHRMVSPTIPVIHCDKNVVEHVSKFKYLGIFLDARLSFNCHLDYIKSKINKNITVFKRLAATRMLSKQTSYKLYYAYIRPYFHSIFNIYPILSSTKQRQLEALNRKIFRIINRWYDATNDEIVNLPTYKSIELLTRLHYTKLLTTIMHSNPAVIADYIQQKMYLLFLREYYMNPALLKEKQKIVDKGRTSNRMLSLLTSCNPSLFDHVFCYNEELA